MKTYDVIVIGSGGGMKLALPAAEMGLRTALIDQDAMGGTCLNRGCIPSKMLIYPTELPGLVRETRKIDVRSDSDPTIDFPSLMRRIQETINGIAENLRHTVMRTPNLDLYPYHGEFISDKILQVGPDQLTAETIFIATGSRPAIPDISGIKAVPFMTSREALSRTDLPRRLLVIGAGYIAVELGTAYAAAGAQVEFIVRSRFLRQEDQEVAEAFSHHFTQTHTVHQGWAPIKLSHDHDMVTVRCRDTTDQQRDFTADALHKRPGPETHENQDR